MPPHFAAGGPLGPTRGLDRGYKSANRMPTLPKILNAPFLLLGKNEKILRFSECSGHRKGKIRTLLFGFFYTEYRLDNCHRCFSNEKTPERIMCFKNFSLFAFFLSSCIVRHFFRADANPFIKCKFRESPSFFQLFSERCKVHLK